MLTGYQLLPFQSRHKREGDDFPNLETQQENEPISGIECLFGFYRSVLDRDFFTCIRVSFLVFCTGKQNFIWVDTGGFKRSNWLTVCLLGNGDDSAFHKTVYSFL